MQYTKHSTLQSHFFTKPRPGRLVVEGTNNSPYWNVVFAGTRALVDDHNAVSTGHLDFRQLTKPGEHDTNAGVANFRMSRALFDAPPQTVGARPQDLRWARVETKVKVEKEVDMERTNSHWPGSAAYVGHSIRKFQDTMMTPARRITKSTIPTRPEAPSKAQDVLQTLRTIMKNGSPGQS